jgi:hypothetical protein
MKYNFTESIYGMSSIRFLISYRLDKKTWSPWAILVSDLLKCKKSSPLKLGDTMNCYFVGMIVWELLCK